LLGAGILDDVMDQAVVDIFALVCGVTGWFYLFYSKAAARLAGVEPARRNSLRVALRRICGGAMVLLGITFFAGFNAVDDQRTPRAFVAVWLGAMALLAIIAVLVAADVRLTWKLRHRGEREKQ
jgi:sterol desaturase/sphingolipid hydroxylase (fatty acid hydroxylase superfamily)